MNISRSFGRYRAGIGARLNGKTYDDLANTTLLDRYVVVNLIGEWSITDNWSLNGKVENALDEDYETAAHYRQPGIGFFVSVSYNKRE